MSDIHNINAARPPSVMAAALDCEGLARTAHWRALWQAVTRSTRLEDPHDVANFIGEYTNLRYTDFDGLLLRSTEREMAAFMRFVNNVLTAERAARTEAPPPRKTRPPRGGRSYSEIFPDDEASARPETVPGAQPEASQAVGVSEDGSVANGPESRPTERLPRPDEAAEYARHELEVYYVAWSSRLRVLDVMRKPSWSHELNDSEMRRALFEIVGEVDALEDFFAKFDHPEET